MSGKTRIIIADDSSFMRKLLTDVLSKEDWIEVIDTAKNGIEALEKIKKLKPDAVTLDIQMPLMDGITCLKSIMKEEPTSVLVISSFTKEGTDTTIKALEEGAIDFIGKPNSIFDVKTDTFVKELIQKIRIVANTKPNVKLLKSRYSSQIEYHKINKTTNKDFDNTSLKYIVAIGTSTGGPRALQEVLPLLPKNFPAAITVVQHMPPAFTKSLSNRLDSISNINIKEAEDGDVLKAGWAYIAPGDYHMRIVRNGIMSKEFCIKLTKEPPVGGHRPAANVMFESLSEIAFRNIIGVIMTGMGNDGCQGLKQLHDILNSYIIAQNEETCVVYGMPKSVVQAGIASAVVPLKDIAKEIINKVEV